MAPKIDGDVVKEKVSVWEIDVLIIKRGAARL